MNPRELRQRAASLEEKRQAILAESTLLIQSAEKENRGLNDAEKGQYDTVLSEARELEDRAKRLVAAAEEIEKTTIVERGAPVVIKSLGDSELRAIAQYVRSGDSSGVGHLLQSEGQEGRWVTLPMPSVAELRHSGLMDINYRAVDSTMNITTAADGGATVPTGLAPLIALRMNEKALHNRLGCQRIPGKGTTVNHVYENADPVVFATTSEQADNLSTNDYERDAMVLATKAFTLIKKTKKLNLTEELLEDNDVNLMEAVADWISRNMATTLNSMLLTEVAANGTAFKTYASATAIAAGEPEDIVFNDTLGYYLDDASSAAWVSRPTTFGNVASITGNARLYAETPGGSFGRELLGYPVYYSNNAAATAASAKDLYFGDWRNVGYRLGPDLKLLQDPYSEDGVVVLKYMFRAVFGVLQAGGIGYGVHPSA